MSYINIVIDEYGDDHPVNTKRAESLVNLIRTKLTEPHHAVHVFTGDGKMNVCVSGASLEALSKVLNWVKRTKVKIADGSPAKSTEGADAQRHLKPAVLTLRFVPLVNARVEDVNRVVNQFRSAKSVTVNYDADRGYTIQFPYVVPNEEREVLNHALLDYYQLVNTTSALQMTPTEHFHTAMHLVKSTESFKDVTYGLFAVERPIHEIIRGQLTVAQTTDYTLPLHRFIVGETSMIEKLMTSGIISPIVICHD